MALNFIAKTAFEENKIDFCEKLEEFNINNNKEIINST